MASHVHSHIPELRASIVYDNILRLSQDSLRSTLTGHFQYRENDKKCPTRRVIINLMDNNKRKPKLVAEYPAACRRRRDGAAATCDDVVGGWISGWTVVVRG